MRGQVLISQVSAVRGLGIDIGLSSAPPVEAKNVLKASLLQSFANKNIYYLIKLD